MQWSRLILQVKRVVEFFARWHHWCYKFVHCRVNRCVQNKELLKCTKNHANWLRRFKDIDKSSVVPTFLAHPVRITWTCVLCTFVQ